MRRPERVVDVDVGVGREGRREGRVVLLLLDVEAKVLEEQDLAEPEPPDGVLRAESQRVAGRPARCGGAVRSGAGPTGRSRRLSWTLPSGRPR